MAGLVGLRRLAGDPPRPNLPRVAQQRGGGKLMSIGCARPARDARHMARWKGAGRRHHGIDQPGCGLGGARHRAGIQRASGHKVIVQFEVGPAFMQKINANAPADIVSQSPEGMEDLIKKGKVVAGTQGRIRPRRHRVVVKSGARSPTSAPLRHSSARCSRPNRSPTATRARSVKTKMFPRLGIDDQIKDKTQIVDGRPMVARSPRARSRSASSRPTPSNLFRAPTMSARCRRNCWNTASSASAC